MSNHITEDIPRLLTGEASRDAVLDAAEHLRSCPDCQQELVSAVVAHASLTSAHRFAPEIVAGPGHGQFDDVESDGDESTAQTTLPPMTEVFSKARQEAEDTAHKRERTPRRRRILAVAAAAIILGGGAVTIAETTGSSSSQQASRTIELAAYDRGTVSASVTIVGNRQLRVDATKLPKLDSSHVYELWLTDSARVSMWPVGTLQNDNKASFTVSPKVMAQFSDLEVSIQQSNQVPYSKVSVLRGAYTA